MNINEIKDQMRMIDELRTQLGDVDTSNPTEFLNSLGVDLNAMDEHYQNTIMDEITKNVDLKFVNTSDNVNPEYVYQTDSGFDLRSTDEVVIQPNGRALIPTGIMLDIPRGFEIQVRSKSGLALNQGLMVLNSPGTVDFGYTSEIKVILFNTTNQIVKIPKGQKVAQAVLCPVVQGELVNLIQVDKIGEKDRNNNGFGSTGI